MTQSTQLDLQLHLKHEYQIMMCFVILVAVQQYPSDINQLKRKHHENMFEVKVIRMSIKYQSVYRHAQFECHSLNIVRDITVEYYSTN